MSRRCRDKDANLWQQMLATINGGTPGFPPNFGTIESEVGTSRAPAGMAVSVSNTNGKSISRLAHRLGVDTAIVEGACSPSGEAPYLQLDVHCWEQMRIQLPKTGVAAITRMAAWATLLALWFREAGLGNPRQSQALAVPDTIAIRDQNPSRGITIYRLAPES